VDGILGHNLLLFRAFSVGIPSWMGFRLSRSLFSQPVTLFTMEFWLSESPSQELFFSFFTMEFWLSGTLFHELFLFSRWKSGYQEAFLTNFFLFSRWNSGYQEAFSHELFSFFTMEF
jgi:hypothetical protein